MIPLKDNISLLPQEIRLEQHRKYIQRIYIIAIIIAFLIGIAALSIMKVYEVSLKLETDRLEQQKGIMEQQINKMGQYEMAKRDMDMLESTIKKAGDPRIDWKKIMGEVGYCTPYGVWLDGMDGSFSDEGNITIRGFSHSHGAVSEFIDQLKTSVLWEDVSCEFSDYTNMDDQGIVQFEIRAILKAGDRDEDGK